MRAVAGVLIVLLTASGCNSSSKLTGFELIVKNVTEEFGQFDETEWTSDSIQSEHTYLGKDLERGERIKTVIDKSLNQVGIKHETSSAVTEISGFGIFYFWDTSSERVEFYLTYLNTEPDQMKIFITRK